MPHRAILDGLNMVVNSNKMWCIGEGKWKTSLLFLLCKLHEQYEKPKSRTQKGELSKLVDSLYASGNHYKGKDGAKGKTTPKCGYNYGYK